MGFNGLVEVGYHEIEAYLRCSQSWYPIWYATLLHAISHAYSAQSYRATDPACASPYNVDGFDSMQAVREEADRKLRKAFDW